jgi:flagellar biosynthesis/type III secretory pathway protein FliH
MPEKNEYDHTGKTYGYDLVQILRKKSYGKGFRKGYDKGYLQALDDVEDAAKQIHETASNTAPSSAFTHRA